MHNTIYNHCYKSTIVTYVVIVYRMRMNAQTNDNTEISHNLVRKCHDLS